MAKKNMQFAPKEQVENVKKDTRAESEKKIESAFERSMERNDDIYAELAK